MKLFQRIGIVVLSVLVLFAVGLGLKQNSENTAVGSVSGPDRTSPCESANGVQTCFSKTALATATTTVCALRAPTFATSTLKNGSVRFSTGTTTTSVVTIARAASAFATTTLIGNAITIAAGAQATILASTTASGQEAAFFAPGQYLVVGMQGSGGTFSPVGSCQAEFLVAQ